MNLYGTKASFEAQSHSQIWVSKNYDDCVDLTATLACTGVPAADVGDMHSLPGSDAIFRGVSQVHPVQRLPKEFAGLNNGHQGSHQFLVDDFVSACLTGKTPPNNVYAAARYLVPGLIAHESALRGGELLPVPDFGDAPG